MKNHPEPSAIKSVGYRISVTEYGQPAGTCDRCSQGIKHVHVVQLKDGSTYNYGSECINSVLSGDTSLKSLWKKNSALLQKLKRDLEVLNRPISEIPVGKVAINSFNSRRFISHEDGGAWMCYGKGGSRHMAFHPLYYTESEFDGKVSRWYRGQYWANTKEQFEKECAECIVEFKEAIQTQIDRIEPFLARILAKGLTLTTNQQ